MDFKEIEILGAFQLLTTELFLESTPINILLKTGIV